MAELIRSLFIETNPGPVKAALHVMARIGPELRLPLVPVSEATLNKVREALVHFGIQVA
jgi:4-hydroxy-tetrahydrodipicolinate synthase